MSSSASDKFFLGTFLVDFWSRCRPYVDFLHRGKADENERGEGILAKRQVFWSPTYAIRILLQLIHTYEHMKLQHAECFQCSVLQVGWFSGESLNRFFKIFPIGLSWQPGASQS